jgi:hypothetical protein
VCVAAADDVTQNTRTGTLGPKKASKQPKKPKTTGTVHTYDDVDEIDEVANDKNENLKRRKRSPADSDSDDVRHDNANGEMKWGLDRQQQNSDWQQKKGSSQFLFSTNGKS